MRAGLSTPAKSLPQKFDLFMKPSMAEMDLFHGNTKDMASLRTLRASLNSPKSTISLNSSSFRDSLKLAEVTFELQALMLYILREMESEPGWCSSHQPLLDTNPAKPILPMS